LSDNRINFDENTHITNDAVAWNRYNTLIDQKNTVLRSALCDQYKGKTDFVVHFIIQGDQAETDVVTFYVCSTL
jgi:hypothetical protein